MLVTNIQRFSLDDGPGIRTTVFLAGCNMRCLWCHNPEALEANMLVYDSKKCSSCMRCGNVCRENVHIFKDQEHQIKWENCKKCLKCVEACESKALSRNARELSVKELVQEIEKDKHFYKRSSGGVTFSGGEPVLWAKDLQTILEICKKNGIHTAVETAGNYPFCMLETILKDVDLVIIDCKAYSEELHKKCTGKSNKQILHNIQKLSEIHKNMWVRIPVIWNVNITLNEMEEIARFLEGKNIEKVEIIPYHKMGIAKYKMHGLDYTINDAEPPTKEQTDECYEILRSYHLPV